MESRSHKAPVFECRSLGQAMTDPPGIYRKDAKVLAETIPGCDPNAMAEAMYLAGEEYVKNLELHEEGSPRIVMKSISEVLGAADELLKMLERLGPRGRTIVFNGNESIINFLKSEPGQWLLNLSDIKEDYAEELEELEDTPFPGRPPNSIKAQHFARLSILIDCYRFLRHFVNDHEKTVLSLVPKMARAIHRIVLDPELPKNSQLFRKEWELR